jgi:hypothetical protein
MYKPAAKRSRFINAEALSFLDEIDKKIEDRITPLLSELFG